MTDRYPEVTGEETGLDRLIPLLVDIDDEYTHYEKAIGLLGSAATEYRYAVDEGEINANHYGSAADWAKDTIPLIDSVIEEVRED